MPKENLVNKSIFADSIDSLSSNNLKSMRKAKKLTLGKLAELTQLSPSYLSRIEVGSRRMNTDILQKLSRILDCHPSDLLDTRGRSSMALKDLPVYKTQSGNQNVDFASPADQTFRPEALKGVKTAFGVYINDSTYEPKYLKGETIFVNPDRPLAQGCSAFAIEKSNKVIIGQFEEWTKGDLLLRDFSEARKYYSIPHATLRVVYRIIGSIEGV